MKVAAMSVSNLMFREVEGTEMVGGCWAAVSCYSIKSNKCFGSLKKAAREHRTQLTVEQRNIDFVKVNGIYKTEDFSK